MPVRRDADGNVIDERTVRVDEGESSRLSGRRSGVGTRPTEPRESAPTSPGSGSRDARRYGAPTTPVRDRKGRDAERTRIYRPDLPDAKGAAPGQESGRGGRAEDDPMADPPVGWLAIVDGPGKGRVATLGIGVNSIGRDSAERVSLDHGDAMISRTNHAAITYDPRGRKFYVQHGGGTNLTYVDDEPVLAPRELEPLAHVQMGNTVLRFVPLCGAGFAWDDESNRD